MKVGIITLLLAAILIFLITGLVGVWAAPNRGLALGYLAPLILGWGGMTAIAFTLRRKSETIFGVLGLICALTATYFTLHFLLTVNWATDLTPSFRIVAATRVVDS